MGLLQNFTAQLGDFEFTFVRQAADKGVWKRKMLGRPDIEAEEICLNDVPVPVLHAFTHRQVSKQAQSAA